MKLIVAIVQDQDAGPVIDALVSQEFRATRINTSGGFLKRGNATVLIGVDEERVQDVLRIGRENAHPAPGAAEGGSGAGPVLRAGTAFVLNVARFVRM